MTNFHVPDQKAGRIQQRQYGLITRDQALECGLTRRQIDYRASIDRWFVVGRNVYRSASVAVTWHQRALAACLAGPPGTVVSHLTAAALYGWCDPPPRPHVTVPPECSARLPLVKVHRSPLTPRDVSRRARIPVTCSPRTLVDVAAIVDEELLAEMVDSALCERRVTLATLDAAIGRAQRRPGRPGIARLRETLAVWSPEIKPGSVAEVRLLRLLRDWGFPEPVTQYVVRGPDGREIARIDLAWPQELAGIEYDSDRWHGPRQWRHDEQRHDTLEEFGWRLRRANKYDLRPSARELPDWLDRRLSRHRTSAA